MSDFTPSTDVELFIFLYNKLIMGDPMNDTKTFREEI